MVASSANPSFIDEIGEEYPSPSNVCAPNLVTVKLSGKDRYNAWRTQILCLLTSHNMLGFINGEVVRPEGNVLREKAWMRSDSIVKSWILGTLSEEVTLHVLNRLTYKNPNVDFTAKDVWGELECIYGPESIQQEIGSSSNSSLVKDPYPSHISTPSLVSVKLSDGDNYKVWKTQMNYFFTGHDMLGFINNGKAEMEAWTTRSDSLVVSWILGTLSEEVTTSVVNRLTYKNPDEDFTAKDVWDELECIYGPEILQQAIGETTEEDATSEDTEAYKKLYKCIVKGKMDSVDDILASKKVSVTKKNFNNGNTALHVAVETTKDSKVFEKLLEKTPKNVSLTDLINSDGSTLLHIAAIVNNTDVAEILMKNYPDMLIRKDNQGQNLLALALSKMHQKFYWSFLKVSDYTWFKHEDALFSGTSGDELLVLTISSKDFYMARNLIWWWCRKLDSDVVLMAIAQNYPCELSFWERSAEEFKDTRIVKTTVLPFVKKKLQKRHEAFQVLKSVCEKIKESSDHKKYYTKPVLEATRLNALEVVKVLVYHFPDAFWSESEDGHNVIQYAVINRSEKIYNLLYYMSEHKNVYKTIKDASRNNLLHLAARLAPSEKLNVTSGAGLQIQYELQWYKEVERFVCPLNITQKNSSQETPQMVFTRTHKELVTEGERWMKSTAESYTITAALITTIVFAAAITVPGGNNQDTGVPIFINNTVFTIFAVSDAISLFTSVMSLFMFLSILTTRFSEQDFLIKLPRMLIIGLVTLFISTATMIIAFGAALFIVFGQNNGSLLIPIGVLTGLTITFFVALQFPLVIDSIWSTYGRSIFGRRNVTSVKCLQNYILKLTGQPIVDDKKKEREIVMMENDRRINYYFVHSADDMPFTI